MIKKLAAVGVGAAMFLATAVPVFALDIFNWADVTNEVNTSANTGGNTINSWWGGLFNNSIHTGAAGAGSQVNNVVNTNTVKSPCGCLGETIITNGAGVLNMVNTSANTGENVINTWNDNESLLGINSITTGPALSQAAVTNIVNTNTVGF